MHGTADPGLPVGGIISIEQAQAETKRWRDHHIPGLGGEAAHTKAFFIPILDIECLLDFYKNYNPTGVRAYIGMKEKDTTGCSPLRVLLVPATETEDFWNVGIVLTGEMAGSSIYDFTTPCPDTCSSPNPLNSD